MSSRLTSVGDTTKKIVYIRTRRVLSKRLELAGCDKLDDVSHEVLSASSSYTSLPCDITSLSLVMILLLTVCEDYQRFSSGAFY